jgi:hypothetical protein
MIQVSLKPNRLTAGQQNELALQLKNIGRGQCTNVVFRIGLPRNMVLLKGQNRIEVANLPEGGTVCEMLTIIPKESGPWVIGCPNFSYRDSLGRSLRVDDAKIEVVVIDPPPPLPKPDICVKVERSGLPLQEWGNLRGTVFNRGPVDLQWATVEVEGALDVSPDRGGSRKQDGLRAGENFRFEIPVKMIESGQVPIHLKVRYMDSANRTDSVTLGAAVPVGLRDAKISGGNADLEVNSLTPPHSPRNARYHGEGTTPILFISADPSDASRLRLGEEVREIREELERAEKRSDFLLEVRMAVRPQDIGREILAVKPRIVHFSGHGSQGGGICLQNDAGRVHEVDGETLADLFKLFSDQVDCVFLNACYTGMQASKIAESIRYVIGMKKAVSDEAAIAFSVGFYQAVGAGRSVPEAFKFGQVQIRLMGVPEHLTPVLIGADG